jgi:hypothetical protein
MSSTDTGVHDEIYEESTTTDEVNELQEEPIVLDGPAMLQAFYDDMVSLTKKATSNNFNYFIGGVLMTLHAPFAAYMVLLYISLVPTMVLLERRDWFTNMNENTLLYMLWMVSICVCFNIYGCYSILKLL